jgi:hypothetical protein
VAEVSGGATLAERLDAYAPDQAAPGSIADKALRRAYMAGAMDALLLQAKGATREQLMTECVAFGRVIGSRVEEART